MCDCPGGELSGGEYYPEGGLFVNRLAAVNAGRLAAAAAATRSIRELG